MSSENEFTIPFTIYIFRKMETSIIAASIMMRSQLYLIGTIRIMQVLYREV